MSNCFHSPCQSCEWLKAELNRWKQMQKATGEYALELKEQIADLQCALGRDDYGCSSCHAEIERLRAENERLKQSRKDGLKNAAKWEVRFHELRVSTRDARRVMRALQSDDCKSGRYELRLEKQENHPILYGRITRDILWLDEWERRNNLPDIDAEEAPVSKSQMRRLAIQKGEDDEPLEAGP